MERHPPHTPPHPPVLQCRRGSGVQRGEPAAPRRARRLGLSRSPPGCSRAAARGRRRTALRRAALRCAAGPARGARVGGCSREKAPGGRAPLLPGVLAVRAGRGSSCASRAGSRPFLGAGEGSDFRPVSSSGTRSGAWGEGPGRCGARRARRGRPAAILWSLWRVIAEPRVTELPGGLSALAGVVLGGLMSLGETTTQIH